jgi:hypothetical protein
LCSVAVVNIRSALVVESIGKPTSSSKKEKRMSLSSHRQDKEGVDVLAPVNGHAGIVNVGHVAGETVYQPIAAAAPIPVAAGQSVPLQHMGQPVVAAHQQQQHHQQRVVQQHQHQSFPLVVGAAGAGYDSYAAYGGVSSSDKRRDDNLIFTSPPSLSNWSRVTMIINFFMFVTFIVTCSIQEW